MTDDPTRIYTDLDGVELYVSDSPREPEYQILHVQDVVEGTRVAAYLPRRVMAALRLAIDLGPDAMLRDIAPLLQQCDRVDSGDLPQDRHLSTREIRRALGQTPKCGNARSELGGARCSLDEHSGDTWHVDPEREIRWRNFGAGFEVRGWSPDEMEVGPVEDDAVAVVIAALDRYYVPATLSARSAKASLVLHDVEPTGPDSLWETAQEIRRDRVAGS